MEDEKKRAELKKALDKAKRREAHQAIMRGEKKPEDFEFSKESFPVRDSSNRNSRANSFLPGQTPSMAQIGAEP